MMLDQDEPVIRVPRKLSGPTVQVVIIYLFVFLQNNFLFDSDSEKTFHSNCEAQKFYRAEVRAEFFSLPRESYQV